jgi:hypothetical protein
MYARRGGIPHRRDTCLRVHPVLLVLPLPSAFFVSKTWIKASQGAHGGVSVYALTRDQVIED